MPKIRKGPCEMWGTAARAIGLQLHVLRAGTSGEIDAAFETIGRERPDALFVAASAFLNIRRIQLVQLAAFHRVPESYALRESVEAGGLMSYGPLRMPIAGGLCRSHPQGRKTRGPASGAGIQVRALDQPPDCENVRPHRAG